MIKAPDASDHDGTEYLRIMRMHAIKAGIDKYDTRQRNAQIVKMQATGVKIVDIARYYSLTPASVRHIIRLEAKYGRH